MMTDAPELKPCPFCGGGARIYQDPSHSTAWFCGCEDWDCFGNMMWDETKTGATDKWNRRADLSSPLGAVVANEELNTPESVAFWTWLPLAYRDGHLGENPKFTKYNMKVAHLAGWQHAMQSIATPTIPLPTHADLLAHAMRLPEVAAICDLLREAAGDLTEYVDAEYPLCERALYPAIAKRHFRDMELVRRINAALEARHE